VRVGRDDETRPETRSVFGRCEVEVVLMLCLDAYQLQRIRVGGSLVTCETLVPTILNLRLEDGDIDSLHLKRLSDALRY
jgi:hypothetical protein